MERHDLPRACLAHLELESGFIVIIIVNTIIISRKHRLPT